MRVGIISRRDREKALETARNIFDILKEKYEVYFDDSLTSFFMNSKYSSKKGDVELLISIGGDGTILKSVRKYKDTPILGVNVGTIGYLSEISPKEISSLLHIIENHTIEERSMISCTIGNRTIEALNDIVIRTEVATRVSQVNVEISGQKYIISGDGVIITTPTGSLLLFCRCQSNQTQRIWHTNLPSLQKSKSYRISRSEDVVVTALDKSCTIVADGFPEGTMNPGDKIEIKKSAIKARFVKK